MSASLLTTERILADNNFRDFKTNVNEGEKIEENFVLKDIRLSIRPGEKIAVCGRTGRFISQYILLFPIADIYAVENPQSFFFFFVF